MLQIEYPAHDYKIKKIENTPYIFDSLRKKWLELTPEEWVRQNFIQYLIKVKKYPATCLAQEKIFYVGEMKKRFDIVVYSDLKPWVLIECKKAGIPLAEKALKQALTYNQALEAKILIITNGQESFAAGIGISGIEILSDLPAWPGT